MISEILFLVEQICPRTSQIDDLRTAIPILLKTCAFEAVKRIRDALSNNNVSRRFSHHGWRYEQTYLTTTDHTFILVVTEGTFVTDTDESRRTNIAITDGTFAIAFIAETANSYTWLLAAHDQVAIGDLVSIHRMVAFGVRTDDGETYRYKSKRMLESDDRSE